jgi:hypothetical protein
MLNFLNNTVFKGKIKFYIKKEDPYYSNSTTKLNKVYFKLFSFYFYSQIKYLYNKNVIEKYIEKCLDKIEKFTNLKIKYSVFNNIGETVFISDNYKTLDIEKYNNKDFYYMLGCYNKSGKYVGDIERGWWYYKNNLIADDIESCVAFDKKAKCYVGYSHRASCRFKIGDRLFEEDYNPIKEDYTEKQWEKFEKKKIKSAEYNFKKWKDYSTLEETIKNTTLKEIIPYKLRGKKVIKNLEESKEAALNFAKSVS